MFNTISETTNRASHRRKATRQLVLTCCAAALLPALQAQTHYRTIYYNQDSGQSAITELDDQLNPRTVTTPATVPGFTQIVSLAGGDNLFYDEIYGSAALTNTGLDGAMTTTNTFNFSPGWLITYHYGYLLFYNKDTGSAVVGSFAGPDGSFMQYPSTLTLSPGWDHIVSTDHGLLFYNSQDGSGATGVFSFDCVANGGVFCTVSDVHYVDSRTYGPGSFAQGWSQVVNIHNGVLFYRKDDGLSAIVDMDNGGNAWTRANTIVNIDPGYSGIVSTNDNIQFYNKDTGDLAIGKIFPANRWVRPELWGTLNMVRKYPGIFYAGWSVLSESDVAPPPVIH